MSTDECIFCKIINGEIPSAKIYEDDDIIAFLDIQPVNPGHTLVVPKRHSADLMEMEDDVVSKVFTTAKKVSKAIIEAMDAKGINIGMNNRKAAGQLVLHSHVHLIPRFEDDGLELWQGGKYDEGQLDKTKDKIRSKMR